MSNPLLEKLKSGGCIGSHWAGLGSPSVAELMVESGADSIIFDLQHGLWTRTALEHAIGLVRGKAAPICRVQDDSYFAIGSALDAGAVGVIVPMVETAEQARACVEAAKYAPVGRRSMGGVRVVVDYKTYIAQANANTLVAVMIETAKGVENAAAIAAVPGIDCVFIGPSDLALSLECFPDNGPKHEAAMQSVLAACRAAGKACGLFTIYATAGADRRQQGFQWIVLANDQDLIQGPSKAAVRRFQQGEGKDLVDGSVALVTGTNRGIGPEIVRALLRGGAKKIYCAARDVNALTSLVAVSPDRLQPIQIDVSKPEEIKAAAAKCGDITLLINNAGVNFNTPLFAVDATDNARREMEVNYFGTLNMCRAFQPILKKNGGGAVVNMLSILALINLPLMGSLCASKAALLSLTQALRAETKVQGTHVMAVLPGAVDTDMTKGLEIPKLAPRQAAEAVIHGLKSRAEEIFPGAMGSGVAFGLTNDYKAVEAEFAGFLPAKKL